MRWDYNDEYRDMFSKGVHRDILIVPHATNVIKVKGEKPIITNKVPKFENGQPVVEGGQYVTEDVDWVIDNSKIVKEKFKYSYILNPADNISFSSASSAMVNFTIRNEKEYNEETNRWEIAIPNLQVYQYIDEEGNYISGELEGNYIIKVYMYFNGDSDTLIYLGMFRVEEDKVVDNGYSREITAYDFMTTFREMDIFNWYKHLFTGINKLDNDYLDATNKTGEETTKPDNYNAKENWVREPKEEWTIREALEDLINNLAAYDMIVYSDDGEMMVGCTRTNPSTYGREYAEGNAYSGFGMPIVIDPNILNQNSEPFTPTEPGENVYEEYGYMKILELKFYENPYIISQGSLSMGKFLEDIGVLAGRYPFIRIDKIIDDDYHDPSTYGPKANRYNNYEKCILSFKPLPTSKDDSKIQPEQCFSNHEIVKGFEHSMFTVRDVMQIKIGINDGSDITYKRLTKSQRSDAEKSSLQTFTFSNNLFCSYLVNESDDKDIQDMLNKYKEVREKLFGTEAKNGNMTANALFEQGYYNIKYRNYVPYKFTTYCDPVRDVGDRIKVNFKDIITGEETSFYTYILAREINGIQKMMDTYSANGSITSPVFSNYQSGTKYNAGSNRAMMFGYRKISSISSKNTNKPVTPETLIEYSRNVGARVLDQPFEASAKFIKGKEVNITGSVIYNNSSDRITEVIKDGDTISKLTVNGTEVDVKVGDYFCNKEYVDGSDPAVPSGEYYYDKDPLYVYTLNGNWKLASYSNIFSVSGAAWVPEDDERNQDNLMVFLDHDENYPRVVYNAQGYRIADEIEGTNYKLYVRPRKEADDVIWGLPIWSGYDWYSKKKIGTDSTNDFYHYGNTGSWYDTIYERITEGSVIEPNYGDSVDIVCTNVSADEYGEYENISYENYIYQYPGIWVSDDSYPDLNTEITIGNKQYVALNWQDPDNITNYQPTPATLEGTIVVRKEDQAPKHIWDGDIIIDSIVKDQYKTESYKDETIESNKTYYYGFFPYYTKIQDPEHPIRYYNFAKAIRVDTGNNSISSTIDSIIVNGNTATINYTLSQPDSASFSSIKIYGKIGSNPSCDNTDDVIVDIDDFDSSSKSISNLEYDSTYYFCLVTVDSNDEELSSNIENCTTCEDESRHLYPKINLNNEANKYTFDQALINWYNAGLSAQRSNISGDASSHITLTNNVYKIDNYPFGAISGNLDFGGGWILYYSYSENTHTYNRDFQSYSWDLKYNGNSVAAISGGTTSPKEIIITFSNNGNGTASIILFSSIGDYMYNQIYQWNTYNNVLTPSGNNAILFHDYLKTHQK